MVVIYECGATDPLLTKQPRAPSQNTNSGVMWHMECNSWVNNPMLWKYGYYDVGMGQRSNLTMLARSQVIVHTCHM